MLRFALLIALILSPITRPALAEATAWQELAPEARMRLVSSDVLGADGHTLVGLELDMPMRMKTYWRVPGETGIPIALDLAKSQGVSSAEVMWPYPLIDNSGGYFDLIYRGRLVLPVELAVSGSTAELRLDVTLGICDEICVPAWASFDLPLRFGSPDGGQALRLRQAMAEVPLPWDGAADFVARYDSESRMLEVGLPSDEIAPHSLIVEGDAGALLFGAPQKSPDGLVVLPQLAGDTPADGAAVTLTFNTPRGPFEVEKPLSVRSTGG